MAKLYHDREPPPDHSVPEPRQSALVQEVFTGCQMGSEYELKSRLSLRTVARDTMWFFLAIHRGVNVVIVSLG